MHHVLMIPEVVHQIMEDLSPRRPAILIQKETRETLLNVALTSRSFLGPALDALWYSIDDLTVLFKLLPNYLPSGDQSTPSVIWDRVLEADVRTFDTYACRVRSYVQRQPANIDTSAFIDILKGCHRFHLLPNLQYLSSSLSLGDTPELIFLMSPRLEVFSCVSWSHVSSTSPKTILDSLRKSSPHLHVLKLVLVALDGLSLSPVGAFEQLEELTIHQSPDAQIATVNVEFLQNISARQTLRHLELVGNLKIVPFPTPPIFHNPVPFPALEHIELKCHLTMDSVTMLLRCATFPVLGCLVIYPDHDSLLTSDEVGHWHQFFNAIGNATTKRFHTLRVGSIAARSTLSSLPNLSSLSLTTFRATISSLHRHDIVTIIDAWPLLIDLSLFKFDEPPKIGFSILIDIAVGLPHLRNLRLSIDSHDLPNLNDIPVRLHGLDSLQLVLFNSNRRQAWDIMQFVDRLFPHLKCWAICPVESDDDDAEDWHEEQDIISKLQQARKDESIRIKSGNV